VFTSCWPYVLVEREKVVGIVALFEMPESLVVETIRGLLVQIAD
jgi:hypothetical protein